MAIFFTILHLNLVSETAEAAELSRPTNPRPSVIILATMRYLQVPN